MTLGDIARIMTGKGEVEAALALHQERLQTYEALGDRRSRAVTLGDIARIMTGKGEVEAALALHQEQVQISRRWAIRTVSPNASFDIGQIRLSRAVEHERRRTLSNQPSRR